jgi:hypothetical protein
MSRYYYTRCKLQKVMETMKSKGWTFIDDKHQTDRMLSYTASSPTGSKVWIGWTEGNHPLFKWAGCSDEDGEWLQQRFGLTWARRFG